MEIREERFKVIVKPNSKESAITGFDEDRKAYKVSLKSVPEKGKANKELVRFLSRKLRRKAVIKSGLKSREKVIELD